MTEKVILERIKHSDYYVNFPSDGRLVEIKWTGAKHTSSGSKTMKKTVGRDVFDYLNLETTAIRFGELKLVEATENFKEIYDEIPDQAEYEANSMSDEDIKKTLKLSLAQMKTKLNKVTARTEKLHIRDVAETIEDLPKNKADFIEEWAKEIPEE